MTNDAYEKEFSSEQRPGLSTALEEEFGDDYIGLDRDRLSFVVGEDRVPIAYLRKTSIRVVRKGERQNRVKEVCERVLGENN